MASMDAIVQIGASQYSVSPGVKLTVNKLSQSEGKITFDQVLLIRDSSSVQVGRPFVPEARVAATVLGQIKGDKVRVSKFKAKSRYDKTIGFRPQLTQIQIDDITLAKPAPKKTRETKA